MVSAAGIASSDAAATRSAIDELIDRWHQRDAQTVAVVEKALEAMASVIASTINVCDVDVVMLGGLWARFEPELIRTHGTPASAGVSGSRGKRACGGYRRSSGLDGRCGNRFATLYRQSAAFHEAKLVHPFAKLAKLACSHVATWGVSSVG